MFTFGITLSYIIFDCQLGKVWMRRECPLLDLHVELRGKKRKEKKTPHQPTTQSLRLALGSQAFFSPEEEAATLSQVQVESRVLVLVSVSKVFPAYTVG